MEINTLVKTKEPGRKAGGSYLSLKLFILYFPRFVSCMYSLVVSKVRSNGLCSYSEKFPVDFVVLCPKYVK